MVCSLERWLYKKSIGRTTALENYFRQLQPFLIHGIAVTAGVVFHFAVVRLLGVKEAGVFFSSFAMYSVFLMLSLFGQQKGLISSLYFKNGGNFGFVLKNIFLGWFTAVLFWQAFVPNVPDVFIFAALLSAVVASLGVYYQYLRRFFIGSVFQQYGVRIGALLLIALAGSNSSVGLSYALLVSAAIFVSIGFLFLPRPRGGSVTPLTMGNLSHRSLLPYWAISVLTTLSDAAPIYLAAVISEPEFAAILAIVIKVAALGSFALVAVNKFSIVSYAARPQDRVFLQKKSARYGFGACLVAIPIFLTLFYCAESILEFFSANLSSNGDLLRWCLLPHLVNVFTGQSATLLMVAGRVDITLRHQFVAAGVLLSLCLMALQSGSSALLVAALIVPPIINSVLNLIATRMLLGFWSVVRLP